MTPTKGSKAIIVDLLGADEDQIVTEAAFAKTLRPTPPDLAEWDYGVRRRV